MTDIRQDASSPAALAQRQKMPGRDGHDREMAGLDGNKTDRMERRRAVKWLCINDILKTNRPK
jgi:hypothetical protein